MQPWENFVLLPRIAVWDCHHIPSLSARHRRFLQRGKTHSASRGLLKIFSHPQSALKSETTFGLANELSFWEASALETEQLSGPVQSSRKTFQHTLLSEASPRKLFATASLRKQSKLYEKCNGGIGLTVNLCAG